MPIPMDAIPAARIRLPTDRDARISPLSLREQFEQRDDEVEHRGHDDQNGREKVHGERVPLGKERPLPPEGLRRGSFRAETTRGRCLRTGRGDPSTRNSFGGNLALQGLAWLGPVMPALGRASSARRTQGPEGIRYQHDGCPLR